MGLEFKYKPASLDAIKRKLESAKKPIDQATAKEVGQEVVTAMKDLIARGQSPIRGKGTFPRYKDTNKYPRGQKRNTPVNLELSGDFLKALTFRIVGKSNGFSTQVGYFDEQQAKKERGHREGVNNQPKRPTIPLTSQQFVASITTLIKDIYEKRLGKLLK